MASTITTVQFPGIPDGHVLTKVSTPAGEMSPVVYIGHTNGASITCRPGAGCTMRVFVSGSFPSDIASDLSDASLTYANLLAGTQPTNSIWQLWAHGPVTDVANTGPVESEGDTAIVVICTGGSGKFEVSR